jgi:serine/threonine-protein kinase HipA
MNSTPDQNKPAPVKMKKLGPGSDTETLKVLAMLPENSFQTIADAGSGIGRQTIALARRLDTVIHAIDSSAPYLHTLEQYSKEIGIEHLVRTHCMDMADIPSTFKEIDLLWSECAAYHIGFAKALKSWFSAIRSGGYAVVSELSWLQETIPAEAQEYLQATYPDMRNIEQNKAIARDAGYQVIATYILSKMAWIEDFYEIQAPLARSLLSHSEKPVRDFAEETLKGIWIFDCFSENYGYVFYILQKN